MTVQRITDFCGENTVLNVGVADVKNDAHKAVKENPSFASSSSKSNSSPKRLQKRSLSNKRLISNVNKSTSVTENCNMSEDFDNSLFQQLNAVYDDLNVVRPSSESADNLPDGSRSGHNVSSHTGNTAPYSYRAEAQKALECALAAEKAAQEARARVDELMKTARGAAVASEQKKETPRPKTAVPERDIKPVTKVKRASSEPAETKSKKAAKPVENEKKSTTSSGNGKSLKRKRYTWSDELHRKFMGTIFDIGLRFAKPKLLLQLLQPAPEGLTTEHIKSHLQKYRNNSKKTREQFYAQFDVAKEQAIMAHDGKALNPGFHAFPMPLGSYPPITKAQKKQQSVRENNKESVTNKPKEQIHEGKTEMDNSGKPGNYDESEANNSGNWIWHEEDQTEDNRRQSTSEVEPEQKKSKSSQQQLENNDPSRQRQTLNLLKQMDAQLQMHQQIQKRHKLQHHHDNEQESTPSKQSGSTSGRSDQWLNSRRSSIDYLNSDNFSFLAPLLEANKPDEAESNFLNDINGDEEDDSFLFKFLEQ